jgi:hypothetical protein
MCVCVCVCVEGFKNPIRLSLGWNDPEWEYICEIMVKEQMEGCIEIHLYSS